MINVHAVMQIMIYCQDYLIGQAIYLEFANYTVDDG